MYLSVCLSSCVCVFKCGSVSVDVFECVSVFVCLRFEMWECECECI